MGSKTKLIASVCAAVFAVVAVAAERVKVSDFGFDSDDSTEFIRRALASGAKTVVFDRQRGPWRTEGIRLGSNIEIVLEEGVELVAKKGGFIDTWASLIDLIDSKDVTIRGEGKGATLRMLREDYIKEPYRPSEHRHGLNLLSAERIVIENLRIVASGGDGIYLGESCAKGLCKEGERGINGPCRDVVIRKCDCDLNHRQGISVISAVNLLIEDTVLQNTLGTPPRAGIDFEPNFEGNKLVNCVMRNCLVANNVGAGYEFYLPNLGGATEPISVTLENCRSVGNSSSVSLGCGKREASRAKGSIRFVNCSFESPRNKGIGIHAKPADAFSVAFAGCTVSNAAKKAVGFATRKPSQGPVDNVDLGDLTVYGATAEDWFGNVGFGFGPSPRNIRGTVAIVAADGSRKTVRLDAAWAAKNMPAFQNGELPPPRAKLPAVASVTVEDACPGQLVDLVPAYDGNKSPQYVFFAEKGEVRLVARRIFKKKAMGNPPVKPFLIRRLDGTKFVGKAIKRDLPGADSQEIVFTVPERGFYALDLPRMRGTLVIEKSSVPLAIATKTQNCLKSLDGRPFAVSFSSDGSPFELLAIGDEHDNYRFRLTDPTGRTVIDRETEKGTVPVCQGAGSAAGFWTLAFEKGKKSKFATLVVDVFGTGGFLFLSPEKRWR